jgi:hypothetical protein
MTRRTLAETVALAAAASVVEIAEAALVARLQARTS